MWCVTNIIKIGGSLAVIIPAIVIEKTGLKKKDRVIVRNNENIVEIYRIPATEDNAAKIDKGGHNVIDR